MPRLIQKYTFHYERHWGYLSPASSSWGWWLLFSAMPPTCSLGTCLAQWSQLLLDWDMLGEVVNNILYLAAVPGLTLSWWMSHQAASGLLISHWMKNTNLSQSLRETRFSVTLPRGQPVLSPEPSQRNTPICRQTLCKCLFCRRSQKCFFSRASLRHWHKMPLQPLRFASFPSERQDCFLVCLFSFLSLLEAWSWSLLLKGPHWWSRPPHPVIDQAALSPSQ